MIPKNNYYRSKGSELACVKHGDNKTGKNLKRQDSNANEINSRIRWRFHYHQANCARVSKLMLTQLNACGRRNWTRFPGRGILPNSSSTPTSSGCTATLGAESLFYSDFALLLTFEQQKKYLKLGINESLRSCSLTLKQIEEPAITDRCSSEPDVSEPPDYGFSLLFTAGQLGGDWFGVVFVQLSVKLPTRCCKKMRRS